MNAKDWREALGALLPDDYAPTPEPEKQPEPKKKPRLTITLDRKRAGKTATIISGFDSDDDMASELAAELKRKLASGGSARGGEILIQGDRVNDVRKLLNSLGYKTN